MAVIRELQIPLPGHAEPSASVESVTGVAPATVRPNDEPARSAIALPKASIDKQLAVRIHMPGEAPLSGDHDLGTLLGHGAQMMVGGGALFRVGSWHGLMGLARCSGILAFADLLVHGDFGLGACHAVDGEMMVKEGTPYRFLPSGVTEVADPRIRVPFALVTHFRPQLGLTTHQKFPSLELETFLSSQLPDQNRSYSIRIKGTFNTLWVRTALKQAMPYVLPALHTKEFHRQNISGTMFGYRFPDSSLETTGAGYHFHFVADDKNLGGHVLGFELSAGAHIEIQELVREEVYADTGNEIEAEEIELPVEGVVEVASGMPIIAANTLLANPVNPLIGVLK